MFVVTHSTESSLNMQAKNPNRMHMYFHASYSARAGMVQDYEYGNDKNAKSGSMAMMPTRYLLELYNENIDARYNAWFREEYKLNTPKAYAWTKDQLDYLKTVIYDWSGYSAGRNSAAFHQEEDCRQT